MDRDYSRAHVVLAKGAKLPSGPTRGRDSLRVRRRLIDELRKGIENPTPGSEAIHDRTKQFHALSYVSRQLSDTSSLSVIFSASHADFQIPNTPDQVSEIEFARRVASFPVARSVGLDENQTEQSYYAIARYQQTLGDLWFQDR
jgi:hypothetical protein